ncbi:hypothetical protein QBC40DRAFT_51786 [Triangularia verruculosa]|uniref:Prolyl oligopeptidase n=1 Tax=Triangularia verruculosa TaxID=2587418 RepID=A0AAN7AYA0_9PEZI|nr:hypothetical protein QBC40DRAFT_51786 [Triangularia verruculosa]
MLPEPNITFTVPSLHDGIDLDCRIYHPRSLAPTSEAAEWKRHAAVFAHPYAPLGGSYDDAVVGIVAAALLRMGFLVGTFNFRGAHGSAGKTSWTGKAEQADYKSVVGFITHYVHCLDPFRRITLRRSRSQVRENEVELQGKLAAKIRLQPPTPDPTLETDPFAVANNKPVLLLGGYSYGSMITAQLPDIEAVMALFEAPENGTPAAEIRLRAEHLAEQQNTALASLRAAALDRQQPGSPRRAGGLRVGGNEDIHRPHEPRRSLSVELEERIRHGIEELMAKTKKGHKKSQSTDGQDHHGLDVHGDASEPASRHDAADHLPRIIGQTQYRPAYLLVSPLQGVVTNLITMSVPTPISSLARKAWSRLPAKPGKKPPSPPETQKPVADNPENKLIQNDTLVIYGDSDVFSPVRKLRTWTARLQAAPNSKFRAHEVSSATHFWSQTKVAQTLRDAVMVYAESLLAET